MKKYEDDLMSALNRWFWYNGLLEAIYDDEGNIKEWESATTKSGLEYAKPVYDKECVILSLIAALETKENDNSFSLEDAQNLACNDFYYNKELNVLWILLVSMFGEYGTSPRSGWIERPKEAAQFLKDVLKYD